MLAHGVRHDQDIGEQDSSVEAEPVDRLERDLARCLAVIGHGEEAALLGAQFAIFGKVPASLAHEPERDLVRALAVQSVEQEAGHRERVQSNKNDYYKS